MSASSARAAGRAGSSKARYGVLPDGTEIDEYTLTNARGSSARIITYGGALTRLDVPDRTGTLGNVVLGYADLRGYLAAHDTYFGALIGRFANRIANARFTIGDADYVLAANHGRNSLHGGRRGFDKAVWRAAAAGHAAALELEHVSPDGDEGYPGTLTVRVTYALRDDDALAVSYRATADRDTVINLTNHTYFNLAGEGSGSVESQELTIDADRYTPIDAGLVPAGEHASVTQTPFDFRAPAAIGSRLRDAHAQLLFARGYDHNWVLNGRLDGTLHKAVHGYDPVSGRCVDILTTEPGVQVYTGNVLDGSEAGSGGRVYRQTAGWTAETQHFPDSPNRPAYPSTLLRAGDTYRSETVFGFSCEGT